MNGSFKIDENSDGFKFLKQMVDEDTKNNFINVGIDYGNGDIQHFINMEIIKLINKIKRRKKGKRYIISKIKYSDTLCFIQRGD